MKLNLGPYSAEFIEGISSISDRYDGFLIDVWGVLHDGENPYHGVIDCLHQLKTCRKQVILLSNSARRRYLAEKDLADLGIVPEIYNHLVTSGELTRSALANRLDERLVQLGNCYYLIGSEHYGLADGLTIEKTEELAIADFVLTIGVQGNPSSTSAAEDLLQEAAERGLDMVCANPDIRVVRDGVMGIGPGALAARFETLGGQVVYFGKPYPAIYQHCMRLLPELDMSRIVAIGDSLKTDIAGARTSGIDSILVGSGIHAKELMTIPEHLDTLAALCKAEDIYPPMIARGLTW